MRETALARLTVIGARAVVHLIALAADAGAPAASRVAALRTLEEEIRMEEQKTKQEEAAKAVQTSLPPVSDAPPGYDAAHKADKTA